MRGIDELWQQRSTRQQFRTIKNLRQGYQPRLTMIKNSEGDTLVRKEEILKQWGEYFENLLNWDEPDRPLEAVEELESELEEPPDEEIREVVKSLKKNKAPGTDLVQVEILLATGEPVMSWLVVLVREIWSDGEVERRRIGTLHKKEDRLVCGKYRGICLLSVGYKVFTNVLEMHLKVHYRRCVVEYQAGFKEGQSTVDQLHVIRQLLEKYWEFNSDSWHMSVDFKQAYDSASRASLWTILREMDIPETLERLTAICYNESRCCCVRVGGENTKVFEVRTGWGSGVP